MSSAATASATGTTGDPVWLSSATGRGVGRAVAAEADAASSADSRPSAAAVGVGTTGVLTAETSPGSTSRPSPEASGAVLNPQSSRFMACCSSGTGRRSACMRLTTSRRPLRSAAATKVCRAASVNPVLPPRVPG
jgi:hypothetical protein